MPVLEASTRPFRRFGLHCRHHWLPNGARVRQVQASGPAGHEIDNNHAFIHIWICHALPVVHFRSEIFAATAAYCAVLVVFASQNSSNNGDFLPAA